MFYSNKTWLERMIKMDNTSNTFLLEWMEELTKYIDILALQENRNNYYVIDHLLLIWLFLII